MKTSSYFPLPPPLFNNTFLFYGCSAQEAEQQHVGLLLILHVTITHLEMWRNENEPYSSIYSAV